MPDKKLDTQITDQTGAILIDGTTGLRTPVDVDFAIESMFIRSKTDQTTFEWPYDRLISYDLKGNRREVVLGEKDFEMELVLRSERDLARLYRLAPKLRRPTYRRRRYIAIAIVVGLIAYYFYQSQPAP